MILGKGGGSRRRKGYLGVMTYRLEFWFACAGSDEPCVLSGAVKEVMKPFLERLLIHQPLCRLLSFSPVFYHEQWHPASFKFLEVGRLPQFCALLLLFIKVFGVHHQRCSTRVNIPGEVKLDGSASGWCSVVSLLWGGCELVTEDDGTPSSVFR